MIFKLRKPDLSKISKEEMSQIFNDKNRGEIFDFIKRSSEQDYLYWDKIVYKEPSPKGVPKDALWMIVKVFRESKKLKTIIKDSNNNFFNWSKLDYFEEFFHELDMNTGGEIFVEKSGVDKANKQKLITRGIMEEAIASSQLEGAATSRQAAKKMLREGRKPINSSEQMIVNSYNSMKAIEENYKDREMSMDLILELHSLITKDTLDSQKEKPRMRKSNESVCVSDSSNGVIYHEGPDIKFVKKELQKLIQFANNESKDESFIHPIIKAIMLHFWMGYLHPFTDGNGRLARMLFYWYLIKKGYWAFVYLPISKVIKDAPKQYTMAYVYSEQDDNDLTYFLDYNIKKIKLAVKDFSEYLDRQSRKNIKMNKKCDTKYKLNIRQVQLLQYMHGDIDERTSLKAHMNVNQIAKVTAIKDLKDLIKKEFLVSNKQGRNVYYYGTEKIKELF
ncbi:MAG: Fic family protein [Candidatus Peregrinibacteria bacterium]|nr:Fic family protein [Candidatus Peregrinibacteria bacterium]